MFHSSGLAFQEFMMGESLPLSAVQQAVLEFLRGREDVVVFGAQAVNAYVDTPRMTEDVDLLSTRAEGLAEDLRKHLSGRFHIAVRVRQVKQGKGYRLFQIRKPKNRRLVDVRSVESLPMWRRVAEIQVMAPAELVASKALAYHQRKGQPKSGTDWRDLALLLLAFPDLKRDPGPVRDCLLAAGVDDTVLATWRDLATQEIQPEDEDAEF